MPEVIDSFTGEYGFLTNFSPVRLWWEGDWYNSAEAAYQAGKLDKTKYSRLPFIGFNCLPWKAKKLGRAIPKSQLWPDWDEGRKDEVMVSVLRQKFMMPFMYRGLLNTGDALLIEGNPHHDNYWGICRCQSTAPELRKYGVKGTCTGDGKNRLGLALMLVRQEYHTWRFFGGPKPYIPFPAMGEDIA